MARLAGFCLVLALAAGLLAAPVALAGPVDGSQALGCVMVNWHVQGNQADLSFVGNGAVLADLRVSPMDPKQSFTGRSGLCSVQGSVTYVAKTGSNEGRLLLQATVLQGGATTSYQETLVAW